MRLYKFRSLGDGEPFDFVKEILTTGKFHCAKLLTMNDPMEGVFIFERDKISEDELSEIFAIKNKHLICSFSAERAFRNPALWGYYANGFKGLAIEIEVPEYAVDLVEYDDEVASWATSNPGEPKATKIRRILTTKLESWQHEYEYRFIVDPPDEKQNIGEIKRVHFGWPYEDVVNVSDLRRGNTPMEKYIDRVKKILLLADKKGIECYAARPVGSGVVSKPFNRDHVK